MGPQGQAETEIARGAAFGPPYLLTHHVEDGLGGRRVGRGARGWLLSQAVGARR